MPTWKFLTFEAGYTFVKDRATNGLVGRVEIRPIQNISLDWLTRFEVDTGTFNENTISVRYGNCCWQVSLRFRSLVQGPGQPNQTDFTVNFELISPRQVRPNAPERESLF
jgi:hypothetical protein